MRTQKNVLALGVLLCLGVSGCAHTQDVSSTPEFKPWIGKTVKLCGRDCNIFAPTGGSYFIDSAADYFGYPKIGNLPEGYPVVIEAVKKTEGTSLIGGMHYTDVWLVLSMEHPAKKNKRIKVNSDLNYVEPFREKKGKKINDLPLE